MATLFINPVKSDLRTLGVTIRTDSPNAFTIAELKRRRLAVLAQQAQELTQRNAEIAEIDALLDLCTQVGVKE